MANLPAQTSKRVAEFLAKEKTAAPAGRLAFVFDATQSRERSWDNAVQLQAQMFEEAGKIGTLAVQLIYFRGLNELSVSPWVTDTRTLADMMRKVRCESGRTKDQRALDHIRQEHASNLSPLRFWSATSARRNTLRCATPRSGWACHCSSSRKATTAMRRAYFAIWRS